MAVKGGIHRDWQDKLTGASYMFAGLNNVLDPYNLPIDKGWMAKAENVDIDNTNSISRRVGYTQSLSTTTAHSGWSDGVSAFFVDGVYLKSFNGATATIIDVVTPVLRMYYVKVNNVIIYSNGIESGFVGGVNNQTSTYSPEFKTETNFGICLEFYNGRVYHAKEGTLYCTDVFDAAHTDIRYNKVATFQDKITMIKRVEDGLFIGTENWTFFLKGNDIIEGGFTQTIVANYGVILGTDVTSSSEYFPEAKSNGMVAVWTSKRGFCTGTNGGGFINHSFNIVSMPEAKEGAAVVRDNGGYRQYISSLFTETELYNPYPTPTFDVDNI